MILDNIKSKIHWWSDDVLRSHCDEIAEWQRTRMLPKKGNIKA